MEMFVFIVKTDVLYKGCTFNTLLADGGLAEARQQSAIRDGHVKTHCESIYGMISEIVWSMKV